MSDSNGGAKLAFFLAGAGIGAILALLFAPKSGQETRDYIVQRAGDSRNRVTEMSKEYRQRAEGYVDKARGTVAKQKEQLSAALEAGKQAYREEKGTGAQ